MAENNLKERLVARVEEYFIQNNWNSYEYDEEYSVFRANIGMSDKCKLKSSRMFLRCRNDGLLFDFTINIGTDDECKMQVMEFITRVNWALVYGKFQMDLEKNNVEFEMLLPCEDVPTDALIDKTIWTSVSVLESYGNELLAVIFGMQSAKDAFESYLRKTGR